MGAKLLWGVFVDLAGWPGLSGYAALTRPAVSDPPALFLIADYARGVWGGGLFHVFLR